MLHEECSSFSKSDDDIGCTEKLKLSISLKDMDPVACTYLSVPKPLYKEMKSAQSHCARMGEEIQLTLCLTGCLCKKKGWQPTSLHRLLRTKQKDSP